jgi:hypothetical protein
MFVSLHSFFLKTLSLSTIGSARAIVLSAPEASPMSHACALMAQVEEVEPYRLVPEDL